MISTLTGWRALRAAPRGHFDSRMAQEGFEPSASLVLSESGLPVAYRAKIAVPGAGIEPAASTFRAWRHYQQQLPRSRRFGKEEFEPPPPDSKSGSLPVSRFPRASRGSRTRLSDLGSPCLTARPGRYDSMPHPLSFDSGSIVRIGDSNPGRLVGSQESCRWTNPASIQSGRRGS